MLVLLGEQKSVERLCQLLVGEGRGQMGNVGTASGNMHLAAMLRALTQPLGKLGLYDLRTQQSLSRAHILRKLTAHKEMCPRSFMQPCGVGGDGGIPGDLLQE